MFGKVQRARLWVLLGAALSIVLFWWTGKLFSIPEHRGHEMSVLLLPAQPLPLLIVGVVMIVCVLLGTLVAGHARFDAGLFAACAGLAALSCRGGTMRAILLGASGQGVYLLMALELVLLYAIVAGAWSVLWLLRRGGWLRGDEFVEGVEDVEEPLSQKLMTTGAQVAVMLLCMLFFSQTDLKKQSLTAVGVSSLIGAVAARSVFRVRPSVWYWIGPLVIGVAGYVLAYLSPGDWKIGMVSHPLARPLPLDYAAMGPLGALIGYWMTPEDEEAAMTASSPASASA